MTLRCYLCGHHDLERLMVPDSDHSVTTDGQLLPVRWDKRQCLHCGLLQSADRDAVRATMFSYQENYRFYDRPFMRSFEEPRYRAYAQWIAEAARLRAGEGRRVLEVGCGAGWVLEELMRIAPGNSYAGIEPSSDACVAALRAGLDVRNGSAEEYGGSERFDVVYSINVIEHTVEPAAFAAALAGLIRPGGEIHVVCPNGEVVDPEMLFADHLFSFTRGNLEHLFARAGVRSAAWSAGENLLDKFQALGGAVAEAHAEPPQADAALLARRRRWMERWSMLDALLIERLGSRERVLCFGAGEMSDLLRAYAPRTWQRVGAYVVDRPENAEASGPAPIHGLPLLHLQDADLREWDAILLGTRPVYHAALYERLSRTGRPVIRWDDVIAVD